MRRKITRIFVKSLAVLFLCITLAGLGLYFGMQSYAFQSWLGRRVTSYLSEETGSTIRIARIEIDFFTRATMRGVLVLDRQNDTLLSGTLAADFRNFDLRRRTLDIPAIKLSDAVVNVKLLKKDSSMNFQHLADYFSSSDTTTSERPWRVQLGDIVLSNARLAYRDEREKRFTAGSMNYGDLLLTHTNGTIGGIVMRNDSVSMRISGLRANEQSGFMLTQFSGDVILSPRSVKCENMKIRTPVTRIEGRLGFTQEGWSSFSDFVTAVKMDVMFNDSTYVHMQDVAYFADALRGLDKRVHLSGKVKGYVSDLTLDNFDLAFGRNTRFKGNLTLTGLPDISSSFLHFSAKQLSTSYGDLVQIPLYPFHEKKLLEVPSELATLGIMNYIGKFDGFLRDFTTYGKFNTALGQVTNQLSIRIGEKPGDVSYHGKLACKNFQLGRLVGMRDLNDLSMDFEVEGKGVTLKDMRADLHGILLGLTYNGYHYRNIRLNGTMSEKIFTGLVTSDDPNANFDFNGTVNFTRKVPELDFITTIHNLQLNELNFTNKADSGSLSTQLLIQCNGSSIDDISGQLHFDNTIYNTRTRSYKLNSLSIEAEQRTEDKRLKVTSEYLTAFARGNFQLSNILPAFESMLYNYYPSYFKKPPGVRKTNDSLAFRIVVKKFNTIRELFLPDVMISPGTTAEGSFDAQEGKLNLQVNSGRIDYGAMHVSDLMIIFNQNNRTVLAEASGKQLRFSDSLAMDNFNVVIRSTDRQSEYTLDWDNLRSPSNKGEIRGTLDFSDDRFVINNNKLALSVTDSNWVQQAPASITVFRGGRLEFQPLVIKHRDETIQVQGTYSDQAGDSLKVITSHLAMQQFNPVLRYYGLKLAGEMNGNVTLTNENSIFKFNGALLLSSFVVNDNTIGELMLAARYQTGEKKIALDGYTSLGLKDASGNQVKNISFGGLYYLERKEESLDLDIEAMPVNLRLLNPFLEGILTIKNGFVNGKGKIHGTPSNIKIDGKFKLFNSEIKVDYTNVSYNMAGEIEVMPDQIRFSEVQLREKGTRGIPQGTLNGNIFHNNFSRIQLDYDITYRNMLLLNTTEKENKTFYGKLYGTGQIGLYGYLNRLHMRVTDTSARGSKFFLPLDGPEEIDENDFIHFVVKDTTKKKKETDLTGFDLEISEYATPSTTAHIIFDKRTGDMMTAQGRGNLFLRINTLGKFEMYGAYMITDGDYNFTMENMLKKKFEIDHGSTISWSGDPMNADIDVSTSYRQRVSVAPLLSEANATQKLRSPVTCKLIVRGKLFSPTLRFMIEFQNLDANTLAAINNVLSDEVELNRQVFSLLLFRQFIPPYILNTSSGGVTAGNVAASAASDMLSNRVNDFLNTYVESLTGIPDLKVGVNYRAGSQNTEDAVDLAIGKQFLNNRLSLEGNFGVNTTQTRGNNGLIGDVNIEYKLSEDGRYRLRGFNRSNDMTQSTIAGGQYTQGVGFFYREEFETLAELFNRRMKKKGKGTGEQK